MQKRKLFPYVRSKIVANRPHAIVSVPGGMKRNMTAKPVHAAQPLFQVNMEAYTSH
jgi:hypothetical protein